ncbi:hypothetical protein [Arthrobacter sp. ISL-69]|uniref:hypothetical protein n=1 Tax=Arthrobacter sp. ISL-69 TaxID=2819113 RepID=UPI001BE4EDB1|nr:hypothetical protein [Arthrobacter sp. ISL-69]MBT2536894.1 hypothetical protein [Arthrobacter sp. ISL-69]
MQMWRAVSSVVVWWRAVKEEAMLPAKMEDFMIRETTRRLVPAAMLAAMLLAAPQPAMAADFGPSDPTPGCPGFDIVVSGTGGNQVTKVTREKNGYVRTVTGGDGFILTFTAVKGTQVGTSITVPTNGSVTHTSFNPDGTVTFTLTGQNVFIYFPTDVGGARTILYTGKAVVENSALGVSTFQSASGKQKNLCDLLSL